MTRDECVTIINENIWLLRGKFNKKSGEAMRDAIRKNDGVMHEGAKRVIETYEHRIVELTAVKEFLEALP